MASSNQGSGSKSSGPSGKQGGTPDQHAEAGKQSGKQSGKKSDKSSAKGSGDKGSSAGQSSGGKSDNTSGVQGGTPEQHAEAGRQSHKNDSKK